MTHYVKLIDRNSGRTTDVECQLDEYLTIEGEEYLSRKNWKHAFVRIPRSGVQKSISRRYIVYAIESERLTVGKIAAFRSKFHGTYIKVACNNGLELLYSGVPDKCPANLKPLFVTKTMYDGRTLYMEVDYA